MTDFPAERRAAARVVKADVDAIFGEAPAFAGATSANMRSLGVSPPRRTSRVASVGVSIALGLAGIAVGALLTRDIQPAVRVPATQPSPGGLAVELTPQPQVTPLAIEPIPEPKRAEAAKPKPAASRADCAKPGGRRCSYSVVMAADKSLRSAYRRAARAGVSGKELAVYRRSWSRLRPAGAHDPDRVVRGYRAMAADLNQLARDRRT